MNWGMITCQVPAARYPDTYNKQPLMYAALASQKNHMAVYLTGIYMSEEARKAFERAYKATGKRFDEGCHFLQEVLMVTIISLWLPIVLSAVLVFLLSSIIHMVLGYHNSDFAQLPKEDEIMDALRPFSIPPGEYVMPRAATMKEMGSPEFTEKITRGPSAFMTVLESGPPKMGKQLTLWFVYSIVIGIFAAYITSRALGPGADYRSVFRFAGATAFIGYSAALWQNSIWYKRAWTSTLKSTFDGLIYALFTAGIFGWLWP